MNDKVSDKQGKQGSSLAEQQEQEQEQEQEQGLILSTKQGKCRNCAGAVSIFLQLRTEKGKRQTPDRLQHNKLN